MTRRKRRKSQRRKVGGTSIVFLYLLLHIIYLSHCIAPVVDLTIYRDQLPIAEVMRTSGSSREPVAMLTSELEAHPPSLESHKDELRGWLSPTIVDKRRGEKLKLASNDLETSTTQKDAPNVGLEPTTTRLRVWCSTD